MIANDQFRERTAAAREPRLVKVEPRNPSTGALRVSNAYDYMGRRVLKVVEEYGGGSWSTNSITKFVYDGWNLALELDGLDQDAPIARYTWGLDLSQTIHGAGGIGGLLAVDKIEGTDYAALCVYDGNGNLGQLIDAATGQTLAEYEYDPYGREIRAAGTLAAWNRIRFSTKYHDPETGLVYYGYRYYSPRLGRWTRRDPIRDQFFRWVRLHKESVSKEEWEGYLHQERLPCYAFARNSTPNAIDPIGLEDCRVTVYFAHDRTVEDWLRKEGRSIGKCHYWGAITCHGERVRRHGPRDREIPGWTWTAGDRYMWCTNEERERGHSIGYGSLGDLTVEELWEGFMSAMESAQRELCESCCCRRGTVAMLIRCDPPEGFGSRCMPKLQQAGVDTRGYACGITRFHPCPRK